MLDSTWAYDYPQALKVGKAIEALGFYWYEDPLDEEDILNYPKLRQQLSIPLMATEYSPGGLYSYAPWIVAAGDRLPARRRRRESRHHRHSERQPISPRPSR